MWMIVGVLTEEIRKETKTKKSKEGGNTTRGEKNAGLQFILMEFLLW